MQNEKIKRSLEYLVQKHGPIAGRTRLLKLLYLADKAWAEKHGRPYTEASYYRWNHGPFAREILSSLEWLDGLEVLQQEVPNGRGGSMFEYRAGGFSRLDNVSLDPMFERHLDAAATRWAKAPLQRLLDHVYADSKFKAADFGDELLHEDEPLRA